jgi:hypothetical protein
MDEIIIIVVVTNNTQPYNINSRWTVTITFIVVIIIVIPNIVQQEASQSNLVIITHVVITKGRGQQWQR